jgi:GNAT superfamily N-acetyltransferase
MASPLTASPGQAGQVSAVVGLGPSDVDGVTTLAASRGWGTTPDRWRYTLQHTSTWGIRTAEGDGLIGSVSLYRPAGAPPVIGAMLVADGHERQGLGGSLLATALSAAGPQSVVLFATPLGEALYRRAGFLTRETIHVHHGAGSAEPLYPSVRGRVEVGPPSAASLAALCRLDEASGLGDRSAMLTTVAAEPGALVAVDQRETAAGLAWPQGEEGRWAIGPVHAPDEAAAVAIVAALAAGARRAGAASIRLDFATEQTALRAWCAANGFPEIRTAPGLVRPGPGGAPAPSTTRRALLTQGFG